MRYSGDRDVVRQVAGVVGALFHVLAGFLLAPELSDENYTLIQPATYAFFVWAPIFLLTLAYAAYQALPSRRADPLLRRVGWPVAGAFFLNGALETLSYPTLVVLTQALVVGMLFCLGAAYLRLARGEAGRGDLAAADRWLVALPVGLFFGWMTAAAVVGASQTLSFFGLPAGGAAEALVGAGLLLLGALLASAVVRVGGAQAPPQARFSYAAAVLWGLVGVAAGQYDASVLTTVAAVVAAALVAWALLGNVPGGPSAVATARR